VEGLDRLPTGGSIIAFNHLSPVDPFLLAWLLADAGHDRPVVLTHRDIPRIPIIGRLLEAGAMTLQDDSPDDVERP
jgi:1-acyl-sn-glycerol-3-phosphate acyltransferase